MRAAAGGLPAAGRWLDVGEPPRVADYCLVLSGDFGSRPFGAAALYRRGYVRRGIWLTRVAFAQPIFPLEIDSTAAERRVLTTGRRSQRSDRCPGWRLCHDIRRSQCAREDVGQSSGRNRGRRHIRLSYPPHPLDLSTDARRAGRPPAIHFRADRFLQCRGLVESASKASSAIPRSFSSCLSITCTMAGDWCGSGWPRRRSSGCGLFADSVAGRNPAEGTLVLRDTSK